MIEDGIPNFAILNPPSSTALSELVDERRRRCDIFKFFFKVDSLSGFSNYFHQRQLRQGEGVFVVFRIFKSHRAGGCDQVAEGRFEPVTAILFHRLATSFHTLLSI